MHQKQGSNEEENTVQSIFAKIIFSCYYDTVYLKYITTIQEDNHIQYFDFINDISSI